MNELGMPPVRPLPRQVRERALDTVLRTMDAPPARRWTPLLAGAAAVAVALTAAVAAGLLAAGPGGPPGPGQLAAGRPITSGDAVADAALIRCAEAVDTEGRAAEYPPTDQWRTSAVLLASGGGETAIAINDAFACFVGESSVLLTSVRGTPAGAVQLAKLTPAILAVLNPERRAVELDPALFDPGSNSQGVSTAPVQLVTFGTADWSAPDFTISVADSFDGPMPEPAPVAIIVHDRPSTTQVTRPPAATTQVAPALAATTLQGCLQEIAPGAEVVLRHEVAGLPSAWAARTGDSDAALCVMGGTAPLPASGRIPPVDALTGPVIVASTREPATGVTAALVAVPADTTRVEIMTDPQPGRTGTGGGCTRQDGLALCTLVETAEVEVVAFGADGSGVALPVP